MDLVLVDGPNLFNMVGRIVASANDDVGDYVREWFDIDRFVGATLATAEVPHHGTVIFHSRKALGGRGTKYRLDGSGVIDAFWGRQGSAPNTSTMLVEIPGSQFDQVECEHCNKNTQVTHKEKGVDTAITSYMFETASSWSSICLFAKDEDYVPPVLSLRRQGKQVFVAHDNAQQATGLVRSCQSFIQADLSFLREDAALYSLLKPSGSLDEVLAAFEKLACSVEIYEGRSRTGPYIEDHGQALTIKLITNTAWQPLEACIQGALGKTMGLDRQLRIQPPVKGGIEQVQLLIGRGARVVAGFDRHKPLLQSAAWFQRVVGAA